MEHSRRTVIKAVAWGAPVIALAVAVPAAAATVAFALTVQATLFAREGINNFYRTTVTNAGLNAIPAGDLQLLFDFSDPNAAYVTSGAPPGSWTTATVLGSAVTTLSTVSLGVGATSVLFEVLFQSLAQSGGASVLVPVTASAPGYTSGSTVISVPSP